MSTETPLADGWRGLVLRFRHLPQPRPAVLVSVGDDDEMTEAEIDELFERTQHIGNAINALAQAELAVAAVDRLPAGVNETLARRRQRVSGEPGS